MRSLTMEMDDDGLVDQDARSEVSRAIGHLLQRIEYLEGRQSRARPNKHVAKRLRAANEALKALGKVSDLDHEEITPWVNRTLDALLRDLKDKDHSECGHTNGHCQFSEAFGLLSKMQP